MLGFINMIVSGLIVGALAKLLMPGKDPGGWFVTILLGIGGSIVAGFLGRTLGWYEDGQAAGWIMSIFGSILILWAYRLFKGKASA
ncbi:MAG: GlsB/YeaQ/YmgE family stress response membrane protein [Bryobacter sp.]|nr:GlsB/YeaQ/YmgE family stress response membrane protein [Bryobacter sp.]